MADVHLPMTLTPLFPGLPRRLELDVPTVADMIGELDTRWPGLRDRLCEAGRPAIRQHIHVYVDRERAGLETRVSERSRVDVIAAISGG
jgi:molybdopterin converting factor small subunit